MGCTASDTRGEPCKIPSFKGDLLKHNSSLSNNPLDDISTEEFNIDNLAEAQEAFHFAHPQYVKETSSLDELREKDFKRLDTEKDIYLDYTGGSLFPESLAADHVALITKAALGNPHSVNPSSSRSTVLCDGARAAVLNFFNTTADEYEVIFTANASGALRIIGESYQFGSSGEFLLSEDNHNSVHGIREFALKAKAKVQYVPVTCEDLRMDEKTVVSLLERKARGKGDGRLFAYAAQSNFSGVKHPLEWIEIAHNNGWDVLVDCAAFVPTNRLDLSVWKPDFVPLSFYKIFGYPTGIGCLLVRKCKMSKLVKPWFSGGTVFAVGRDAEPFHILLNGGAAFEDGTIDYLSIPAVELGLRYFNPLRDAVHLRVELLTTWLLHSMQHVRGHATGSPLLKVFGPGTLDRRGGTIAFRVLAPDGSDIDDRLVAQRLADNRVHIRNGCFCNPGVAFRVAERSINHDMYAAGLAKMKVLKKEIASGVIDYDGFAHALGWPVGLSAVIRVSIGLATNFSDVYRFMSIVEREFRDIADPHPENLPHHKPCP